MLSDKARGKMLRGVSAAVLAGIVCIMPLTGWAAELPHASPEEVGLSAERLARLDGVLGSDVRNGRIPGAVALILRHGKVAYFKTFGLQSALTGTAMRDDSIFRIYSMTKPIVSTAVMMLWEEGRFDINDPVAKYLPELKDLRVATLRTSADGKSSVVLEPARSQPTIQQLLNHTGGLSYDILPKRPDSPVRQMYADAHIGDPNESLSELVAKLGTLPLANQPGSIWEYSRSADVLARLVEVVSGVPIDRFLRERIFEPLGMTDTGFWVPEDRQGRIAEPLQTDDLSRVIDVTRAPKFLSGNYGLVSTAEDYGRFVQMLLNGGSLNDKRILARKTVEYMTSDQIGPIRGPLYLPGPGYGFGLGFAVRLTVGQAPDPGSVGDYFWGGSAGTIFWVDPKEDLSVVFMTQRFGDASSHYQRVMRTLVYQALSD